MLMQISQDISFLKCLYFIQNAQDRKRDALPYNLNLYFAGSKSILRHKNDRIIQKSAYYSTVRAPDNLKFEGQVELSFNIKNVLKGWEICQRINFT
ncbi:hypothetical protein BK122_08445 [Paenibacillus pabuli]|nr:hypothetical protein BK122_08445 [Paenibacillus pabuli]